ncbi:MAG TPA: asparagine synthase (glutamine-hydrolyzing) [Bryobacteraceae bacterium]|nr:asparagine synthase (glutamine-hydrolyzing) [Bryobacteraceae bacterium]
MCGIVAVSDLYASSQPETALEAVRRGIGTLHHRGPDSQNYWNSTDGLVSLGHARLSIIDLAGGDQPLANEDQSIHAIVNGEFYDFERIRAGLQSRGHCFRTHSDSEILLHLYEDFGVECVHHLRGEFAFVLWDSRQRRLFAARDRFGIKPLFYSESRGRLLLASEVKALHAAGVPAAWDDQGFADTLAFFSAPPRSLFRGVSSVPPGHYMVVARGTGVSTHRYWDWDFAREDEMPAARPDREYIEEFRSLLDDAVNTRLRADVPVGCYLSGGIDSCSVLALMAQHAPGRVRAFSLGFDHSMYDEGPIAREMAARTGAEFTLIPISHTDMARDLSDALWHCESFFINGNSAAKFALSRAVRDAGYKVVLTGEGSDEVLAGYAFFRMDLIRHQSAAVAGVAPGDCSDATGSAQAQEALRQRNAPSAGLMLAANPVDPTPAYIERLGYFPAFMEARKAALERMQPALAIRATADELVTSLLDRLDVAGQMTGRHPVNQSQYAGNKSVLPNYILTALGDRVEMAHSIEARLPFLDHHLVEFARRLPVSMKINGVTEKYVLREALRPMLTETVYNRQKHPFLSPPALLKPDEPLHALLQDTVRGSALARVPYFDRAGTIRLLDEASQMDDAGKIAMESSLMIILSACILADRFHL